MSYSAKVFAITTVALLSASCISGVASAQVINNDAKLLGTLKDFAAATHLDEASAKLKLERLDKAGVLVERARKTLGPSFSSFAAQNKGDSFSLQVTKDTNPAVLEELNSFSQSLGLGQLSIAYNDMSEASRRDQSRQIFKTLKDAGIDANVSIDSNTNKITIIVKKDPARLKSLIENGAIKLPDAVVIEEGSGIITTKTNWPGGTPVNIQVDSTTSEGCTVGFPGSFKNGSDPVKYGFVTAAHCVLGTNQKARIDAYGGTYYAPSNLYAQSYMFLSTLNQDVTFVQFNDQVNNLIRPGFWNGQQYTDLESLVIPYQNAFICKYGRTSGRTCGFVDTVMTTDNYGTFYRVLAYSAYPKQSIEGDSGGPVFQNSAGVGIVHGRDSAYNLYFSSIDSWNDSLTSQFHIIGKNGQLR